MVWCAYGFGAYFRGCYLVRLSTADAEHRLMQKLLLLKLMLPSLMMSTLKDSWQFYSLVHGAICVSLPVCLDVSLCLALSPSRYVFVCMAASLCLIVYIVICAGRIMSSISVSLLVCLCLSRCIGMTKFSFCIYHDLSVCFSLSLSHSLRFFLSLFFLYRCFFLFLFL